MSKHIHRLFAAHDAMLLFRKTLRETVTHVLSCIVTDVCEIILHYDIRTTASLEEWERNRDVIQRLECPKHRKFFFATHPSYLAVAHSEWLYPHEMATVTIGHLQSRTSFAVAISDPVTTLESCIFKLIYFDELPIDESDKRKTVLVVAFTFGKFSDDLSKISYVVVDPQTGIMVARWSCHARQFFLVQTPQNEKQLLIFRILIKERSHFRVARNGEIYQQTVWVDELDANDRSSNGFSMGKGVMFINQLGNGIYAYRYGIGPFQNLFYCGMEVDCSRMWFPDTGRKSDDVVLKGFIYPIQSHDDDTIVFDAQDLSYLIRPENQRVSTLLRADYLRDHTFCGLNWPFDTHNDFE